MDIEFIRQTAETAWSQLFWSVNKWTVMSWGVSKRVATIYNNMPTLALKVSGLVHKGWVYISLNEGKDVYEVRLFKNKQCIKTIEEVYCDNLGETIDELVEKPTSMSEEEYSEKAKADSMAKLIG